mmetsp:Transcript_54129/g.89611  ORF Transcript_54129/g.89611 Transcript_54129/m.89611 type:complete len:231 (+) Transcript_54129:20-712(+)
MGAQESGTRYGKVSDDFANVNTQVQLSLKSSSQNMQSKEEIITDIENIDDFLNEQKNMSQKRHLQRLWIRDSTLWMKQQKFNRSRLKFLTVVKLCKSLHILSVMNDEQAKRLKFEITAVLSIHQKDFAFVLCKWYESEIDIEKIKNIDSIEWDIDMQFKDKNAYQSIVQAFQTNNNNSDDQKEPSYSSENKEQIVQACVSAFSQYVLQWLTSHNVELFRIQNLKQDHIFK